jgi:hypothetical protein
MRLGLAEHLHDAGQQSFGARAHVHGVDRKPQRVDADQRSNSRIQAAHSAAAVIGQVIFRAAAPRRSSIWMSTGAAGDVVCAMETGTNCGTLAAVLAGKVAGPGGDMTAPSRSRASLRQPCTMFAFTPCDIATLATDAPGAAHCSSTNAFNSALCRRRNTTLSAAIVSTYLMDTIMSVTPPPFKVPRLDAYATAPRRQAEPAAPADAWHLMAPKALILTSRLATARHRCRAHAPIHSSPYPGTRAHGSSQAGGTARQFPGL